MTQRKDDFDLLDVVDVMMNSKNEL